MLKGLRRKAEKLARAAAAALTFLAPRYPALVCAIVAGERLAWGAQTVGSTFATAGASRDLLSVRSPPVAMETPLPPASFQTGLLLCVSAHTRARAAAPLYPTRTKSLAKCLSSLAVHVCVAAQQ